MITYGQTNLQLFNQLRVSGYSADETALVRDAYRLAMRLFTGCFRPSGKPFLVHAVGAASLLSALRAPASVVAAGLLHAAYTHGEFGTGWRGISMAKRRHVRRAVGFEVEDLAARYTALRWNKRTMPHILEELGGLSALEQHVVLIRLANELEDHLDLGVLYCADAEDRLSSIGSHLHLAIPMAERLGYPELASALDRAFKEVLASEVPVSLRSDAMASYTLGPASHRTRLAVALRRFMVRPLGVLCRGLFGWRRGNSIEQAMERALAWVVLNWGWSTTSVPGHSARATVARTAADLDQPRPLADRVAVAQPNGLGD
jgi:hypothetical protein